ncbi:Long-chain base-1-phosphate phosphatase [Polyrhizophydium stewartii]|uniref:Long-chain base-1-phosphate phosphatase n=1 Tax=Polyrhizophydium stewartii TaxID=2732419 RepID=A0ABR4N098_9FUNG
MQLRTAAAHAALAGQSHTPSLRAKTEAAAYRPPHDARSTIAAPAAEPLGRRVLAADDSAAASADAVASATAESLELPLSLAALAARGSLKATVRRALLACVEAEAPLIARIQKRYSNPVTEAIAKAASALGTHEAYLVALPLMFWFVRDPLSSPARHYALGLLGVFAWANTGTSFLKDLLCLPRPPTSHVQRKAEHLSAAREYGFPSTHTGNAVGFSLFTALFWLRSFAGDPASLAWFTTVLVGYASIVAASRILKGMHSFVDVLGGAAIGLVVAYVFSMLVPHIESAMASDSGPTVPAVATLLALFALVAHPVPADACPCFDDSLCFLAAWSGAVAGVTHRIQLALASPQPVHAGAATDWTLLQLVASGARGAGRVAVAVTLLLAWRVGVKRLLPAIARGAARLTAPGRTRHGRRTSAPKHLLEARARQRKHAHEHAHEHAFDHSYGQARHASECGEFQLPRFSAAAFTRFVVYFGIGVISTDVVPRLCTALGL